MIRDAAAGESGCTRMLPAPGRPGGPAGQGRGQMPLCALRRLPEPAVQAPLRHEQMACGFPRKARLPIRPGCGDSPQGRTRRPSRPAPARCLRFSSRSCLLKPEHPTPASAPSSPPGLVPRRVRARVARQARAEPRRPLHRQWPAHRAATGHVTACLSGVRSGDEDDPVPGLCPAERAELPGGAGRTARPPGRIADPGRAAGGASRDLAGRIALLIALSPWTSPPSGGRSDLPSTGCLHRMFHLDAG